MIFIVQNIIAFTVFGIPTVERKNAYYLTSTLNSLITQMTAAEKLEVVIVVFVPDHDRYLERVIKEVKTNFPREVEQSMIQVLSRLILV